MVGTCEQFFGLVILFFVCLFVLPVFVEVIGLWQSLGTKWVRGQLDGDFSVIVKNSSSPLTVS